MSHRPYLLRKRDVKNHYRYSREAAIESAKADLLGRRAFMFEKPQDLKVNSGGYRVLNSYIVLGVAIKMEPLSPRAEELRRLLDVVAGLAPDELGRVSEPIVRDELAIVEFLTQRASQPMDGGGVSGPASVSSYSVLGGGDQRTSMADPTDESAETMAQYQQQQQQQQPPRPGMDDSAWSFVAPGMAGLDVQQPFSPVPRAPSEVSMAAMSAASGLPGPLRPPPPRGLAAQLAAIYGDSKQPGSQSQFGSLEHSVQGSPARAQSQQLTYDAASMVALQNLESQQQQQQVPGGDAGFPPATNNSGDGTAGGGDLAMDQTAMAHLDNWWNDLSMGQNTPGVFNPFALAQFGQTEEGDTK